uniref:Uncharacterized protein n=1 Tax=Amphora coffeiformis TaxID=265554 RepID=A0A7S3LA52_9STRA
MVVGVNPESSCCCCLWLGGEYKEVTCFRTLGWFPDDSTTTPWRCTERFLSFSCVKPCDTCTMGDLESSSRRRRGVPSHNCLGILMDCDYCFVVGKDVFVLFMASNQTRFTKSKNGSD